MKKLTVMAVALMAAAAVSSRAQEADRVLAGPIPITLEGKLSGANLAKNAGSVTGESVNGTALEMAEVQFVSSSFTGTPIFVIGSSIGTSNVPSGGSSTDVDLVGTAIWDNGIESGFGQDTVVLKTGKTGDTIAIGLQEDQVDIFTFNSVTNANSVISNSFLDATVTFSASKSGTNVTGKFTGIWKDGDSVVNGTIKNEKTK